MKTSDFYFDLPEELIAQVPLENRQKSRMMMFNRKTGAVKNEIFENIVNYVNEGDCLVLNNTRVLPARIYGNRVGKEECIEVLLLKNLEGNKWECLVKPGRKMKIETKVVFGDGILEGTVIDVLEDGNRIIEFKYEGIFNVILDKIGSMPLPPYITAKLEDKERYQTVYNKYEGSAAAPTAGLHFTNEVLSALEAKGVNLVYVTLHVGLGTFRPVKVDDVANHKMHTEEYHVTKEAADKINEVKKAGGKIISVGTTSCRVLESATDEDGIIHESNGDTSIFIYPGYKFKMVDKLLTNFHLPESTLIMLISALSTKEHILNAYAKAVEERYRFFSFGDCMFIGWEE
ncbi:MAG: tRNA preQ1(34) S-adenosylmethionine ribosyltransferase-isomerase QueA [Clostridia bacterium]